MKRIVAMVLAVLLCFSSSGEILAAGVHDSYSNTIKTKENTQRTGYMAPQGFELAEDEQGTDTTIASGTETKFSQVYNHEWDKYSSNYYYNKLSKDEKELWDALDQVCIYYLEKKDDITNSLYDNSSNRYATLDEVPVKFKLSKDELYEFWMLFTLSNPQYYFVLNTYFWRTDSSQNITGVILTCYDAFTNGETRAKVTKQFKLQIDKWEDIVETYNTEEEKVKVIHDLVCEKVTYNHDTFWGGITQEEEQTWFTQSAYSVFCMDTTVCAGYSDAMAIMCNAVGLDAVSVTSPVHQWNKVRVNDIWYNYDSTWADGDDNRIYYEYYARSDARYQQDGFDHIEEAYWGNYSVNAVTDVVPTDAWSGPGRYPEISKKVETPKISITGKDNSYTVKITCSTKIAKIYYTIDGKTPSSASTKASLYKKAFKVKKGCTVKAIAVGDGYKDSKIATQEAGAKGTSIKDAKVQLSKSKYYYDGKTKKPEVTVTLGKKELVRAEDYEVSYKNNKNIGKATVTIKGIGKYQGTIKKTFTIAAKTGTKFTSGNNKYKVISSSAIAFIGIKSSKTKVTVPSTVKYGGKSFKVTKIADNALKNKTKVKEVVIGTNLKEIGKQSFYGCKNLKAITVKSTKITKVGKNALKGIYAKARIKVSSKKLKAYKTLFKNKGQGKKVKIIKSK